MHYVNAYSISERLFSPARHNRDPAAASRAMTHITPYRDTGHILSLGKILSACLEDAASKSSVGEMVSGHPTTKPSRCYACAYIRRFGYLPAWMEPTDDF